MRVHWEALVLALLVGGAVVGGGHGLDWLATQLGFPDFVLH